MTTGLWLALALVGAVGAVARYVVDGYVASRGRGTFPVGTLAVNVTGSLALGAVVGLAMYHALPTTPKVLIGSGFCGAYTTFSTLTFESAVLVRDGSRSMAALNVVVNVTAGCAAAAAGLALAAL